MPFLVSRRNKEINSSSWFSIAEQHGCFWSRSLQRWYLLGLSIWFRCHDNLGHRYPGCWSVVDDDRYLRRSVRHGGLPELAVGQVEACPIHPYHRHCANLLRRFLRWHQRSHRHERHPQRGYEPSAAIRCSAHHRIHQQRSDHGRVQERNVRVKYVLWANKFLISWTELTHEMFFFSRFNKVVSTALSILVISINIYFVSQTVSEIVAEDPTYRTEILVGVSIFAVLYLLFCLYLVIHMSISMGATCLNRFSVSISRNDSRYNWLFSQNKLSIFCCSLSRNTLVVQLKRVLD